MTFSVIIPTCGRDDLLAQCLDRMGPQGQSLSTEHYEVIVSDDSPSSTAEALVHERFGWARWVAGPKRGPAANRNNGAHAANGEWLVFTDDDCLPSRGWLEAYWDARNCAQVLEGLTRADRERESFAEESPINLTGGFLWSCNFAIRKELFQNLNGFDESFPWPALEDCDLRDRIQHRGLVFPFVKCAEVIHPWRTARREEFWEKHHASYLYYLKKHNRDSCFSVSAAYFRFALADVRQYIEATIGSIDHSDRRFLIDRAYWLVKRSLMYVLTKK